jgi:hypothetical protein
MKSKLSYFIFISSIIFLIDIFLIHLIRSDLDWVSTTLSWYAVGDNGYILAAGFCLFAGAEITCSVLLVLNARLPVFYGQLFFSAAGIGALLATVFPVQSPTVDLVLRLPHIMGAIMQFMFFPLALIGIYKYIQDGHIKRYTRLTATVTSVFFIILLTLLFLRPIYEIAFYGLLQKIDILFITLWMIMFSFVSMRSNIFKVENR